jgi:hypothetical protein
LVIVKKEPFTQAESELIINQTATLGSTFQALYVPYVKDDVEPYSGLFNGSITLQQFSDEFSFKATPVTDDSPFFFNTNKGVPSTLNTLMIISISLAAFSIAVPSLFTLKTQVNRKIGLQHNTPRLPLWLFVLFFSALGVGYMLIEIASVQKFLLFLGNPTRALSVILFSLLLSSGIGSIVSGRLATKSKSVFKGILLACTCVILFTVLYSAILPQIFSALLAADSSIRILTTVLLIFPLGFFMGIPFPSAMRILNVTSNESIPWVWGINGAMSVLGSVLATVSGILFGFSNAILFGAATYLVAFLCAAVWLRMKAQQTQIQEPELMDNLSLK